MVDPLLAAGVVVQARVHGQGPLLFLLDPDARTTIDISAARQLQLFSAPDSWTQVTAATDRNVPRRPFEVLRWTSGDLTLSNFVAYSAPAGSLEIAGRQIHGIIGGDLLSRSIVIDIDRDRGVVGLHQSGGFVPGDNAAAVPGRALRNPSFATRGLAVPTHLRGLGEVELVVALSAPATALRKAEFTRHPGPIQRAGRIWLDGSGDKQRARSAKRGQVVLGPNSLESILIDELPDQRLWSYDYVGVLGQDVLSRYRATYDRDRRRLLLAPRTGDLAATRSARIARWSSQLRCEHGQCVQIGAGRLGPWLTVRATTGSGARSVTLEPIDGQGTGLGQPLIVTPVSEAGYRVELRHPLPAGTEGFRVVDVAPLRSGKGIARWQWRDRVASSRIASAGPLARR